MVLWTSSPSNKLKCLLLMIGLKNYTSFIYYIYMRHIAFFPNIDVQ